MKKIALFAVLFFMAMSHHAAANDQTPVPSSWSLDLSGGAIFGHFSFDTDMTPHGELYLRYSLNPVVSIYGNAGGGVFQAEDNLSSGAYFENNYLNAGVGARVNILRMLGGANDFTNRVGVFTQSGIGIIMNDVDVSAGDEVTGFQSQSFTGNALLYRLGGGLTLNLGRRLDFFALAEMNFSNSDLLDGYERQSGSDVSGMNIGGDAFVTTSAGFSIKFGGSRSPHADWQPLDHRSDPLAQELEETVQRVDEELQLAKRSMDTIDERIRLMQQSVDDLSYLVNEVHSGQLITHYDLIEDLQARLDMLEEELEEAEAEDEVADPADADAYFVIAGVFRSLDNAENHQRNLRNQGFSDVAVIRDRNNNYYMVAYSGHSRQSEAQRALDNIRTNVNPDAWLFEN